MTQVAKPRRAIVDLLQDPENVASMSAMLPRHMTAERMTRLAFQALRNNPELLKVEGRELLGAFLGCSALGLEPNTPLQHIYLIPFKNGRTGETNLQIIVGYRGFIELGRRSGAVQQMHADVVYPDDDFDFQYGTETFLRHRPKGWDGDPKLYTHAYCHVRLADGQAFVAMPRKAIIAIRDKSQGYRFAKSKGGYSFESTPWNAHEPRMARKTPIRALYGGGEVPMSIETQAAYNLDERALDFKAMLDLKVDPNDPERREHLLERMQELPEAPSDDDGPDARGAPRAMPQPQQAAEPEPAREPAKPAAARPKPAAAAPAQPAISKTAPVSWTTSAGEARHKPNVQAALQDFHSDLMAEVEEGTVVTFANLNVKASEIVFGSALTAGWRQKFMDLFAQGGVEDPLKPPPDGDDEAPIDPQADASGQDVDGDPRPDDGGVPADMFPPEE